MLKDFLQIPIIRALGQARSSTSWPSLWVGDPGHQATSNEEGRLRIQRKQPVGIHVFVEQGRQCATVVLTQLLQELMLGERPFDGGC